MEQDQIHILTEKMEELKAARCYAEFKRKRSLYLDHFFDAEKHEIERDELQEQIDSLRIKIQEILANPNA